MGEGSETRWAGRHADKDALRDEIWSALEAAGVAISAVRGKIPNFGGAAQAADHLASCDAWRAASVVKCNPDAPQTPVRLRALSEGKTVYAPVPELTKGFPFVKIDPEALRRKSVPLALAATARGFLEHGEPVEFEAMPYLPFCVVGCVAVSRAGGRTGKGAGFADLELGIFRELGKVDAASVIATTVHSIQLVADSRIVMQAHDSALHLIATELGLIRTEAAYAQPKGVDWAEVQPDQFTAIPFLSDLRTRIEKGR